MPSKLEVELKKNVDSFSLCLPPDVNINYCKMITFCVKMLYTLSVKCSNEDKT